METSEMSVLERLIKSLRENGARVTLLKLMDRVKYETEHLNIQARLYVDGRFDRFYGVDTSGYVDVDNLDISVNLKKVARPYTPTPVPTLRSMLRALAIDHSNYTFVDFGSGKGRPLLLASEYPFKRIVGIEFSHHLHSIAQENFRRWNSTRQKCFNIESVCIDARDFVLPDDPLVIFLFNPFQPPVTSRIVDNIGATRVNRPRPIKILTWGGYGNYEGEFMAMFARLGFSCREVYRRRPFSSVHVGYRGHLWESNDLDEEKHKG